MKLTDIIHRKTIIPQLKASDKRGVIEELVKIIRQSDVGADKLPLRETVETVMSRERMGSTGLGGGVAVPHGKVTHLKNVVGAFGRSDRGLDFNAVDGEAVQLVFLILSPPEKHDAHLTALKKIMWAIKRQNFCKFLKNARTAKQIEEIFKDAEEIVPV